MGRFPADMPYQEETLLLAASSVPHHLGGLWNYAQIIATTDTTDVQEVSFNQGQTWTRLRAGMFVPIGYNPITGLYDGTTGLAFRNPTGGDITIRVAVGFGRVEDHRLILSNSNPLPVESVITSPLDAGDGRVLVDDEYSNYSKGQAFGEDHTSDFLATGVQTLLASAAHKRTIYLAMLVVQVSGTNESHRAIMYADSGAGKIVLAYTRGTFGTGANQLVRPIRIPANVAIKVDSNQAGHFALAWVDE